MSSRASRGAVVCTAVVAVLFAIAAPSLSVPTAEAQSKPSGKAKPAPKPAASASSGVKDGRKPGSGSCNNADNKCSGTTEVCRDNLCFCQGVMTTNTGDKLDWRRCEANDLVEHSCTDIMNAHDHCGGCNKRCGGNQECTNGKCKACERGKTQCYGWCVSLASDDENCGKCGHRCPDGLSCTHGSCQP